MKKTFSEILEEDKRIAHDILDSEKITYESYLKYAGFICTPDEIFSDLKDFIKLHKLKHIDLITLDSYGRIELEQYIDQIYQEYRKKCIDCWYDQIKNEAMNKQNTEWWI